MIVFRCSLNNAVAEPDVLRALAYRRQEHFRGAGVGVFLQEVMLHFPDVFDAEAVRQLALIQRILKQGQFRPFFPGSGQLVFVEDAESHETSLDLPFADQVVE